VRRAAARKLRRRRRYSGKGSGEFPRVDIKAVLKQALPDPLVGLVRSTRRRLALPAAARREWEVWYERLGRPPRILGGPFQGMAYLPDPFFDALLPKFVGSYEKEIHPAVSAVVAVAPDVIVNVGSAEGYYAVGLARLLPQARVVAFEGDPWMRGLLQQVATLNQVADRVEVRGYCDEAELGAALQGAARPVVLCDCEGYEAQLMDPARVPALAASRLLVELHDLFVPGVSQLVKQRFAATHDIESFPTRARTAADCPVPVEVDPAVLERALCEGRAAPMAWCWMTPKVV